MSVQELTQTSKIETPRSTAGRFWRFQSQSKPAEISDLKFGQFLSIQPGMMMKTLTAEEKELARQLWDMSADHKRSTETMQAFLLAPQIVCDAIDGATQQPQYREAFCKNPFSH